MRTLKEYIKERLSDVKTSWHPKKGLFTGDDPKEIVDYLLKNSKDEKQAMQRLCFYMNRAGDKLTNKTVLNDAKRLLKKENVDEKLVIIPSQVDEKLVINKNYSPNNLNKCLVLSTIIVNDKNGNKDQLNYTILCVLDDVKISNNSIHIKTGDIEQVLKRTNVYDDYYHHEIITGSLSIGMIGLEELDGIDFLNKLIDNIPDEINIHDYFDSALDKKCYFGQYNSNLGTYKHYTKNDIEKFIEELNK